MKKLFALLLALAMLLCMAGCTSEKNENSSDNGFYNPFGSDKSPLIQRDLQYYKDHIRGDVYWTKPGSVFHTHVDCYHLANDQELICGSLEAAFEAGKDRPCKTCLKREGIPTYEDANANDK